VTVTSTIELSDRGQGSDIALRVDGLSKRYGNGPTSHLAIERLDFAVRSGEFLSIVGPSGCGKTTLLKCMSGLLSPTSGETVLRGSRVSGPPKDLAIVFQDYSRSLLPWATVRKNVTIPIRKLPAKERDARVDEALEAVGLSKFADRYPWQLSGGMQQRVAIARALSYRPRVLLMDEPFASVDAQTRSELEDLVLRLSAETGVTSLLVTHDIDEAVYMGSRVLVLTPPPCRVKEELVIDLPRPRNQIDTKELPAFAHLRAHVYRTIRSEVEEAAAEASMITQPDPLKE